MKTLFMLLGVMVLVSLPAFAKEKSVVTMAVFPVQAPSDIDQANVKIVEDGLVYELRQLEGYRINSIDEIEKVLDLEQKKQLMGCDESSCLVEIAGALGVDKIVSAKMGRVASLYAVSLKVVNMETGVAEKEAYRRFHSEKGEELLTIMQDLVFEVFPEESKTRREFVEMERLQTVKKRREAAAESEGASPWTWVALSVGIAGAGAGVYGTISYMGAKSKIADYEKKSYVPKADVDSAEKAGKLGALLTNVGYSVAGAGLVAAIIIYFTTRPSFDDDAPPSAPSKGLEEEDDNFKSFSAAPALLPNGVGITLSGRM